MANLPADLPEDWTSSQKITPNGTEVGLSEQHGYNYLMKQVNDTQNEVNNIGTTIEAALEDVAKEASVQEIITSIGETDDTGGSTVAGTVMGKLNTLIDQDDMQSNKLDTVLTILGSGVAEYTSPGTYQLEIPAGITKIKVTACAGGGGGGASYAYPNNEDNYPTYMIVPAGGSGGQAIVNQEYTLENTGAVTTLNITVGAGGAGGSSDNSTTRNVGKNGGATVIGNLVTLAGGQGGTISKRENITSSTELTSSTTPSAGQGSGSGAAGKAICSGRNTSTLYNISTNNGEDGINAGTGGTGGTGKLQNNTKYFVVLGGAGGGSIGKGGNSGTVIRTDSDNDGTTNNTSGNRGGGGAGGSISRYYARGNNGANGKSGGNGYVKIEWGL